MTASPKKKILFQYLFPSVFPGSTAATQIIEFRVQTQLLGVMENIKNWPHSTSSSSSHLTLGNDHKAFF